MEHDVEALPISLSILAELAQKGHAYAKALHYRELEFQTNPAGCFESLININKKLDQYDAASGLLKVVEQIQKKFPALKEVYAVQESWLAKLGHWDTALVKYNEKLALMPHDSTVLAGKMKCLDALGRWEEAIQICEDNLDLMRVESEHVGNKTLTKAAVIGARAAWSLNQWDRMDLFLTQLPGNVVVCDYCYVTRDGELFILKWLVDSYTETAKIICIFLDAYIISLLYHFCVQRTTSTVRSCAPYWLYTPRTTPTPRCTSPRPASNWTPS